MSPAEVLVASTVASHSCAYGTLFNKAKKKIFDLLNTGLTLLEASDRKSTEGNFTQHKRGHKEH